jgi:hypothetical protein
MKMIKLLIAALLAISLLASTGSMITAPSNLNSFPDMSNMKFGFSQLSTSDVGKTPILFAPSQKQLLNISAVGSHVKPRLMTNNYSSSLKNSGINQMFAMMAQGLGQKAT